MVPLIKVVLFALLLCSFSNQVKGRNMVYSLHASCKIKWTFGIKCTDVTKKITDQIDAWKGDDCGSSEKCRYKYGDKKGNILTAKHETPSKHYLDDLTFTFNNGTNNSCNVDGYSTSETWYAVLDYGTNYCNLHNLITGSGLDKVSGYTEKTSNNQCTQFTSANCDKY